MYVYIYIYIYMITQVLKLPSLSEECTRLAETRLAQNTLNYLNIA